MEEMYEEKINRSVEEFFDVMRRRVTQKELDVMRKAFELARDAHSDQKRKSGEPYIIHPIAVAKIVGEEMLLDTNPVCAAFLHDVVEDTDYTIEDIERLFGRDVAFLVRVVTKSKKHVYETSKQVDNFKQMLDSLKYDIRALLIKLADRLHNMRTLSSMLPDKQMKIAGETDFFYAPLANRLGLYRIKIELENLSFRYRCPREYANMERLLAADKEANKVVLDDFMTKIDDKLKENGINAFIECEYRQPFSIRRKMQKTGQDFNHIEHRHFVRIVYNKDMEGLSEKGTCLKIYALLTDIFKEKPGSLMNYIDAPKENGYQSLHVKLLAENGHWEEVHISSERMRRMSRFGCVAGREQGDIANWIKRFRSALQDIVNRNHDIGFMEGVTASFYNDDIKVFTPTGDIITLPQGSTAIDFAFEVHSKIGLHAQYARINGRLSSVKTTLHRGDCVEIGTKPTVHPHEDWLKYAHSYKAKLHINAYLRNLPKYDCVRCEHCAPLPKDEVVGFMNDDGTITVHRRDCRLAISQASQDGDSVLAIEFTEMPDVVYPVNIHVKAVDRFHLLSDLIDCITNRLHLSIDSLKTVTQDQIVDCDICFFVHSCTELETAIADINSIDNVDEVEKV